MRAILVDVDKEETALLEIKWAQWGCGVPLIVLPSPYRSILRALLDYVLHTPEDPLRSAACVRQRMELINRNLRYLSRAKGKAYRGLR